MKSLNPAELGFKGILVDPTRLESLPMAIKDSAIVAMEFPMSFNLGTYQLPSLQTIAALTYDEIIEEFLNKYVQLCLHEGVDYLIVPDLSEASADDRRVISSLLQIDSSFFIARSKFDDEFEKLSKKELRESLSRDQLLLMQPPELAQAHKNLSKLSKENFKYAQYTKHEDRTAPNFSTQLISSIYQHSVVHFGPENSMIPLNVKSLGLLSPSFESPLKSELKRYYQVEDITEKSPKEGQVILVDARVDDKTLLPFIESYRQSHRIIALVSQETSSDIDADEYLLFPEQEAIHDILIPQMLYGASGIDGDLIELVNYPNLRSSPVPSAGKLRYAPPDWEGVSESQLKAIDSLANQIIASRATPGFQVSVVKGSSIIYNKAYGYLTYDSLIEVNQQTIYDIASVTKVLGTLLVIMDLYDEGKIDLEDSISMFLPQYLGTNKQHITIKQLLAHQSGLRAYEPLWKKTISGDFLDPFSYGSKEDEENDIRLYGVPIHPIMMDSLRNWLTDSPLAKDPNKYRYSDLGFMLLQQVVESISGVSLERYLYEEFYEPMGLHYTVFNPLEKGFELFEIAPTEFDQAYRKELIWGRVHDRNAAIFGGIAGHAGLFSNALELAIIMRMILNDGSHGGKRYLSKETINTFNKRYFAGNRRALGWDKYDRQIGNASSNVSAHSFGHTGFTGTMVWADPEHDLVYSFVSNRIYPDSKNYRLQRRNYRSKIQNIIYEAFYSRQ